MATCYLECSPNSFLKTIFVPMPLLCQFHRETSSVTHNVCHKMTRDELAYLNCIQKVLNVLTGCLYVSPQGMSDSLPSSSDILEAATKLKEDVDGLNIQASLTRDRLNEEKNKAKEQINQAKNVRMSAYIKLFEKTI